MKDESYYRELFAVNLRRLIESADKSQKEIADAIGVSKQTFNNWVIGIAMPRMNKVQALADYFHIDKSVLLEDHSKSDHYYINEDARNFAEFLFKNPEYRVLFSAVRDVKKEDLQFVASLLDRFQKD